MTRRSGTTSRRGPTADEGAGLPERAAILRSAVGIGLYAAAFGASFGAVSVAAGLTVAQTLVLSLVMFSGASQFAFVGVAAAGGSPWAAVPAALLLGVRNAFYGVPLTHILRPRRTARIWTAHFVIDETTAMAVGQPTARGQRYAFWATGLVLCALWQVGTAVGAGLGAVIDPRALGLDAASPAVYLALLWPGLARAGARWVALAGAAVALVLVPLAPAGVPVVAAAGVALVAGLLPRGRAAVALPDAPEDPSGGPPERPSGGPPERRSSGQPGQVAG